MVASRQPPNQAANLATGYTGQQLHVSGVFIVLLEIALVVENLLPILVVVIWLPARARGVGDRLVATFSVTCILSALVPTPLGLASYFSGGWYGGASTCTTYQVTSIWCNLSSLALLTSMCVNCIFAVWRLRKITPSAQCHSCHRSSFKPLPVSDHAVFSRTQATPPYSSLHSSQLSVANKNITVSSRHISPSKTQHTNTSSLDKHTVKQGNSVSMNINNCNVETSSKAMESSDNDSENIIRQQNNALFLETEIVNNSVKIDHGCENEPQISRCQRENIKRLGNEHYICLEEDFIQCNKHNCNTSHIDQLSISSGNTDLESCHSSYLQKTLPPQDESSHFVYARNNNRCSSEKSGTGSSGDNSHNGSVSTRNKISRESEYEQNCEKVVSHDDGNCIKDRDGFSASSRRSRDYVSLMMFFLFVCTLAISSLPVVGFGPRSTHSEKSCRSWLVPIPANGRERTFYVTFISFVYVCLALGCSSGISVCLQVSKRMKHERRRKLRLYHEEENVPDIAELSVLDDLKRQYSLTCVAMAGLLTWLPIAVMLTLQKAGVQVSEATLMYSNIATSLPGLLNPLLYSLALAKYRTGYKAIMGKCCCNRKHKNHRLRVVQSQANMADDEASTDTALDTSITGHTCIHGRLNPNNDNLSDVNDEVYDDDNDDDDFLDENEQKGDERKAHISKLSEKTPLQAILVSLPPAGAFRTILANRAKSPWQQQNDAFSSSSNDNDCLLVSSSDFVDEETGL